MILYFLAIVQCSEKWSVCINNVMKFLKYNPIINSASSSDIGEGACISPVKTSNNKPSMYTLFSGENKNSCMSHIYF